eukprot:366438-Chlamydomonas_euryale.AAC.8
MVIDRPGGGSGGRGRHRLPSLPPPRSVRPGDGAARPGRHLEHVLKLLQLIGAVGAVGGGRVERSAARAADRRGSACAGPALACFAIRWRRMECTQARAAAGAAQLLSIAQRLCCSPPRQPCRAAECGCAAGCM